MPTLAHPMDSIERFAEICAVLDDGFTDRATALHAAGLDAASWRQIEERWMERLAPKDAVELAATFGEMYARTRASFSSSTTEKRDDPAPEGPRFLGSEAQPWRGEAAAVAREVSGEAPPLLPAPGEERVELSRWSPPVAPPASIEPLAGTANMDGSALRAALPFLSPGGGELTGTLDAAAGLRPPDLPFAAGAVAPFLPVSAPLNATLDLNSAICPPSAQPAVSAPGKRLVRFDPQTGRPLAVPIWIDIPTPAASSKL